MSGSPLERCRPALRWAGGVALLLLLSGCAYSFRSGLPGHIRTVAVPGFAHETSEFGLAEEITERLLAAIVRDATLRVVTEESRASSVLEGTVRTYAEEPRGYTRDEQVEQFQVQIVVAIRFTDRVRDQVLWESTRVFGSATYANTGPEARTGGLSQAIGQVVDAIMSGVVAGW